MPFSLAMLFAEFSFQLVSTSLQATYPVEYQPHLENSGWVVL